MYQARLLVAVLGAGLVTACAVPGLKKEKLDLQPAQLQAVEQAMRAKVWEKGEPKFETIVAGKATTDRGAPVCGLMTYNNAIFPSQRMNLFFIGYISPDGRFEHDHLASRNAVEVCAMWGLF